MFFGFEDGRLGHFTVEERRQHGEHVRLDEGVQDGEEHAHDDGKHKGEREIGIDKLRDEEPRKKGAEETETHGDGQGKFLQRPPHAAESVGEDAAREDDEIGQTPHHDRPVDVGKGRGQGDGSPRRRHPRDADELDEGADADVRPRRKEVCPQKVVAVRAVVLREALEHPYRLFQKKLELVRDEGELRDDEDADDRREHEQDARDDKGRKDGRIDGKPEEADLVALVQDGVLHRLVDGARLFVEPVRQNDARDERADEDGDDDEKDAGLFFGHRSSFRGERQRAQSPKIALYYSAGEERCQTH